MTESNTESAHLTAHEHAAPMRTERAGPLADVRIVDLTQALAGPYCTMLLADLGADVIKVEPPKIGDPSRVLGPHTEADDDHHFGGYFASNNRNKRSIALNLKDEDDKAVLRDLVATSDVLIENYRAGVMDRLDLSYESLRDRNPRLIYGAIRGFGDPRSGAGPYTDRPAFDIVAQAMSGMTSHTGTTDGELVSSGPSIGDLYPATMLALAVVSALHERERSGEGQFVDVSMVESLTALCESMVWRWTYTGTVQPPRGSEHPSLSPFELYDAADGKVAIAAPGLAHWADLCEVIGRPDMVDDDKFRSARRRVINREEVRSAITAWSGARTKAEVVDALDGRVPCGPVNNMNDLHLDPHVQARGSFVAVEHEGSSRPVLTPDTSMRFSRTQGGVFRGAPRLGQHDAEIRAELEAKLKEMGQ